MFKKIFLGFIFLNLTAFLFPLTILSQSEFDLRESTNYFVNESGSTEVIHNISLTNLYTNLYATNYLLTIKGTTPLQPLAYDSLNHSLPVEVSEENGTTSLKVLFPNQLVGKNKTRQFSIKYTDLSLITKTGEVWEISIPRLTKDKNFNDYSLTLSVPNSLGNLSYIFPPPTSTNTQDERRIYSFDKDKITSNGISAAFGEFQVFSFEIIYHLENPLKKNSLIEIAIPPDTAFQKVNYNSLKPNPVSVNEDKDGNWIAIYKLSGRQTLEVKAQGSVQIFSSPQFTKKVDELTLKENLMPTVYWQSDDSEIKDLALKLKTPKAIYQYVVSTLSYDFDRVKPNIERFGAKKALQNPKNAICMEFTDLFIALSRAAGIPAREINGYAYTENPELQPLSLVADVLHSWPEYYDPDKGIWVPVDPTWESTSGQDFFSKLDLRHFSFVIHGTDPVHPYPPGSYKLGSNPQKDVFISFGKPPEFKKSTPSITAMSLKSLPFSDLVFDVKVTNPGPQALRNLAVNSNLINILPPFGTYNFKITLPLKFLGWGLPKSIRISANDQSLEVPTGKNEVLLVNLSLLSIAVLVLTIFVYIRIKDANFLSLKRIFKGHL